MCIHTGIQKKIGTTSVSFANGASGGQLRAPSHADWAFGTGEFYD